MIKGVFFDVGGTLYSYQTMPSTLERLVEMLAARLALKQDINELMSHYQAANKVSDKEFAVRSFYLFRDYFKSIFTGFLDRIDQSHNHHHFDWFEENQRAMLIGGMQLMPGCHETLARLKDMGLYLSAVSNADNVHLEPMVERGQFARWLTHWTSSETAQSCKPDMRFFEIALEKSGLPANQVMFVGDSLEQDIGGAHAMGMTTVLITEVAEQAPMHLGLETPDPDFRISKLSELPEIIEKVGRRH
jgi:HAD superfamily hydrolase (TIGR01509 family)